MKIDAKTVKELRDLTALPMMQCKHALEETGGDVAKAQEWLAKQGAKVAEKKAGRATDQGAIGSYIHHDSRLAVLVEVNCESAQVAKTEDFAALIKDIAIHIASADPSPLAVARADVKPEVVEREKELILGLMAKDPSMAKKPDEVKTKVAEGRLNKFFSERVLLEQPFVKDSTGKSTVKDRIDQAVLKLRENIAVKRFIRYRVGEE